MRGAMSMGWQRRRGDVYVPRVVVSTRCNEVVLCLPSCDFKKDLLQKGGLLQMVVFLPRTATSVYAPVDSNCFGMKTRNRGGTMVHAASKECGAVEEGVGSPLNLHLVFKFIFSPGQLFPHFKNEKSKNCKKVTFAIINAWSNPNHFILAPVSITH